MSIIQLSDFDGIYPRYGSGNLPDNAAVEARNVKLQSGEIRSWRSPEAVHKVKQKGVQSIMKMEGVGGTSLWLEWTEDTDYCYSPVADDEDFRIYYSEGGVCKKTNWDMCSKGDGPPPRNWLYMGVPSPKKELTLKANRVPNDKVKWKRDYPNTPYEEFSSTNTDNRVYVYTYISQFGKVTEESAPSGPCEVVCDTSGGSVEISGFGEPPTDHYNIVGVRIYRAVVGRGSPEFLLVDELPFDNHQFKATGISRNGIRWTDSKYIDTLRAARLGKPLDSMMFNEPPKGLRGLVSMPNGFLAGFVNNQVWFSEPYMPHAWPSTYMLTTDSPIVGLGVYGNTLVVCTTRQPYTISGTHPSAMSQEKQPMVQPCVSKRSIAYDQYGVLYASAYGLVAIAGGQMDVFTRELVSQDEWREFNPSTMNSMMYNNLYIAAYHKRNEASMLVFARGDKPALVQYDFDPIAIHVERGTGRLYCLKEDDNTIYQMDASVVNREPYVWHSKRFFNPFWTSFSAMKMDADFEDNDVVQAWESLRGKVKAANAVTWRERVGKSLLGEVNGHMVNTFEVNGGLLANLPSKADSRSVSVTLIADGKEIYHKVFTDCIACRIPAVRAHAWEVRFAGTLNIRAFAMATTMVELASPK